MNVKERFDSMTEQIEKIITDGNCLKPRDVAEQIAASPVMNFRDLNTIFQYLTGHLLLDYIRERQLMEAYSMLISIPVFDVEMAITVSGYDNQSSFSKKFKQYFGVTPKEAFLGKDETKLKPVTKWDMLSAVNAKVVESVVRKHESAKFGIPKDKYLKLIEAADYQALYEFDDIKSEVAFNISEEMNAPLKQAFEFVDEFCLNLDTIFMGSNIQMHSVEDLETVINSIQGLKYVYFNLCNSLDESLELIGEARKNGYNIDDIDIDLMKMYLSKDAPFKYFMSAWHIYESLPTPGVDFEEFLMNLSWGMSVEDAQTDYDIDFDFVGIEEENKRIIEDYEIEETYTDEFLGIDRTGKYDDVVMDDYDDEDDEYEEDGEYYDF